MSDEAAAYYQNLFEQVFNSPEWQEYLVTESMSPMWLSPDEQRAYWAEQVEVHRELLEQFGG
jgi:tripartite-type tricarboxylate transporter receptor subunit TctC